MPVGLDRPAGTQMIRDETWDWTDLAPFLNDAQGPYRENLWTIERTTSPFCHTDTVYKQLDHLLWTTWEEKKTQKKTKQDVLCQYSAGPAPWSCSTSLTLFFVDFK